MNSFMNRYLYGIYAAMALFVVVFACVICWNVNGWRMGKLIAEKQTEIVRLSGVIDVLNERGASLGREREIASAVAEKAKKEASALRVSVNEKTKQIMALKASSCGAVLESEWGKP